MSELRERVIAYNTEFKTALQTEEAAAQSRYPRNV